MPRRPPNLPARAFIATVAVVVAVVAAYLSITVAGPTGTPDVTANSSNDASTDGSGVLCGHVTGPGLADCLEAAVIGGDVTQVQGALARVRAGLEGDEDLGRPCHDLVHRIGATATGTIGAVDALAVGDQLCDAGYVHGVVETFAATTSTQDYTAALGDLCTPYRPEPGAQDQTTGPVGAMVYAQCLHALGHGAGTVAGTDIDAATALCATLDRDDPVVGIDLDGTEATASQVCAAGVFMVYLDRFKAWQHQGGPAPRPEDVPAPDQLDGLCTTTTYPQACYARAGDRWAATQPGNYPLMLERCAGSGAHQDRCAASIGRWALLDHRFDPDAAVGACDHTGDPALTVQCRIGIAETHAGLTRGFGDPFRSQCHHVTIADRDECHARERRAWDLRTPPRA